MCKRVGYERKEIQMLHQWIHEHFPVHFPIVLVFLFLSNQAALMHRSIAILPIFCSARQIMVLFNFVLREASDTDTSGTDRFITKNRLLKRKTIKSQGSPGSCVLKPIYSTFQQYNSLLIIRNLPLEKKCDKDENLGKKSTLWEI